MLVFVLAQDAFAGTVTLRSNQLAYPSIQAAVDAAVPNDTVTITGTVVEGDLVIDDDLTILGSNATLKVVHIEIPARSTVALVGLDIVGTGPTAPIESTGILSLLDCEVSGSGAQGGAIAVRAGALSLERVRLHHADADEGGALFVNGVPNRILPVTLVDVTFEGTTAGNGGAIYASFGDITCTRCVFEDTEATAFGGAVLLEFGSFDSVDSSFSGAVAPDGAALYSDDGAITLSRTRFCGTAGGQTIFTNTSGSVRNSVFADSTGSSDLDLEGTWTVENNSFLGGGLAIESRSPGTITVVNNLFADRVGPIVEEASPGLTFLDFDLFDEIPLVDGIPLGAGVVIDVDPMLRGYTCAEDDFLPSPGSPLVDAGDPALLDPDGSRSDIGASGGPDADGAAFVDEDGDGLGLVRDCDDADAAVGGAVLLYPDLDADGTGSGTASETCAGPGWATEDGDCDDFDATVVDRSTFYADADGDGFGDAATSVLTCHRPAGHVLDATDCDDGDAAAHAFVTSCVDDDGDGFGDYGDGWEPGAALSTCGLPPGSVGNCEDCDDTDPADHLFAVTFLDGDGDGYGTSAGWSCATAAGTAPVDGDCDDFVPTTFPGAIEVCDGIDDNCTAGTSDEPEVLLYVDADGDGSGDPVGASTGCSPGPGQAPNPDDCDDGNAAIHPGAVELCDGVDDNCTAGIGDEPTLTLYSDIDGDGFGRPGVTLHTCVVELGWVIDGTDCNDDDETVYPGAPELCDARDQNCVDGVADEPLLALYRDGDGDGWGNASETDSACEVPAGWTLEPGDCDDDRDSVHPGAPETCDTRDEDCNGIVDDLGAPVPWYADADADGFGDPEAQALADCRPEGFVADATDCDDGNADVSPDAVEVCNGIDDDCSGGAPDDVGSTVVWYTDDDGDGHGHPASGYGATCAPEGTWVAAGDDCDDTDAAVWEDCAPVSEPGPAVVAEAGCGCTSAPGPTGLGWLAVGLVGLGGVRRRWLPHAQRAGTSSQSAASGRAASSPASGPTIRQSAGSPFTSSSVKATFGSSAQVNTVLTPGVCARQSFTMASVSSSSSPAARGSLEIAFTTCCST